MMAARRYTTVVFYAAVLVALAATYGVYHVLQKTKQSNRVVTQPVVVAAKDIPEGARIERADVRVEQWPAGTRPVGSFASLDSVVDRVTRLATFTGEVIVPGRLAPNGTGPGLEVKIAPGMRAMAVKINDVAGVSGLLQPNSHVDVLVTLNGGKTESQPLAKMFMENMRVLSVGTHVERGADGKPINATTVALEVTPDQAERLAIAAHQGSIQLVLRGYGDPDSIATPGATVKDVLAQLRNAPAPKPEPKPRPRRVPRHVAERPAPRPDPVPPPRVVTEKPPRPDTLVVKVYRGDRVTQQKFEKKDSTVEKKDSTGGSGKP
ncbi:MAG TPA: Flp pilus assembly protein CpaB [Gemmatimonadaceae bacterium]|nr:Flp pilus assembly protein CpaB [Gemmatimonadaceae bacterium]